MSELKAITSVFNIEIEKIDPNPDQPRKHFSQESLNDLAESIRRYGVMQPITVVRRESQTADGGITTRYEIIAGERRWRASIVAGMASIPAIVREAEETEQERFELSILENLQREDLNPVDKARSFARLADEFDMKHAEIADKLGKSREYVTNALRLLVLPDNVLDGLSDGDISEGHTRPLLTLKDKPDEMQVLFNEIKTKSLTVREAEKTARELSGGGRKTNRYNTNQPMLDPEMESLQQELAKSLGTTVSIDKKEKGGKLTIDFFSRDDLKKLLSMVGTTGMADVLSVENIEKYDQSTIAEQGPSVVVETNTAENHEIHTDKAMPNETQEDLNTQTEETQQDSVHESVEKTQNTDYDEPRIINEYIVPKTETATETKENSLTDDVLGEDLNPDNAQENSEIQTEQISHTDTVDLVGSQVVREVSENTTQTNEHSVTFDDGFTITPQARITTEEHSDAPTPENTTSQIQQVVLDESLAHKDIVTQSAHATHVIDRGVGSPTPEPVVETAQPTQFSRAANMQAEIDAIVGMADTKDLDYNGEIASSGEPMHLDLGELELHKSEFRKEEPAHVAPQAPTEDNILSEPIRTESGAIVDSVIGSTEGFVPNQPTEAGNHSNVSVTGSDFIPTQDSEQAHTQNVAPKAEVTMGGLGGGNINTSTAPTGPGVTNKYPQGDPYRLDNFSL